MSSCNVPQETRGFDHHRWDTYKLRSKEDAPEYRYMPDPNLCILHVSEVNDSLSNGSFFLIFLIGPNTTSERQPSRPCRMPCESVSLTPYEPFGVTQIDIDVLMGLDTGRDIGYGRRRQYQFG